MPLPKVTNSEDKNIMCTCTKSSCIKNYCDCYKFNQKCSSRCRCIDCKNTSNTNNDKPNKEIVEFTRIEISGGSIYVENGNISPVILKDSDKKSRIQFKVTPFNEMNKSDTSYLDSEVDAEKNAEESLLHKKRVFNKHRNNIFP